MIELRLSSQAVTDLETITAFSIQRFGRDVASRYLDDFDAAFLFLAEYPEAGPVFPGVKPIIRAIACGSHRIFYRLDGDEILVVRILHQAMEAPRQLRQ